MIDFELDHFCGLGQSLYLMVLRFEIVWMVKVSKKPPGGVIYCTMDVRVWADYSHLPYLSVILAKSSIDDFAEINKMW